MISQPDDGAVTLSGPDGAAWRSLTVRPPLGWKPAPSDDDEVWMWRSGDLATGSVRFRTGERMGVVLETENHTDQLQQLGPFRIEVDADSVVPWLAGASGEVVMEGPDGAVAVLHQVRGTCAQGSTRHEIEVFDRPVLLRPHGRMSAEWRVTVMLEGAIPPEPDWLPERRYLSTEDEPLLVGDEDTAVAGDGLHVVTTDEGSHVQGPPGLHDMLVIGPRGTTHVEVGWHRPVVHLVEETLALPDLPLDISVWLRTWQHAFHLVSDEDALDALDRDLGEALTQPSLWGVLAGLVAGSVTPLPVTEEARDAARELMRINPSPELVQLSVALPDIPVPEGAHIPTDWDASPQEWLRRLDHGRVMSAAPSWSAHDLLLAELWLARQQEASYWLEVRRAIDVAAARLWCQLSVDPDPVAMAQESLRQLLRG